MGRLAGTLVTAAMLMGLAQGTALAQLDAPTPIEQVDPDAKKPPPESNEPPPEAPATPEKAETPPPPAPKQTGQIRLNPKAESPRPPAAPAPPKQGPAAAAPAPVPAAPKLPPLRVDTRGDAELLEAWARWRKAETGLDAKAAEKAQADLNELKGNLGISDLDAFSVGFSRAADERGRANDASGAVALAQEAVELAPDLPFSHLNLARTYLSSDPTEVARYMKELQVGLVELWTQPRYGRAELADVGAALLFAVLATAAAVTLVLFLKGSQYFLHDFHHLFPRAAARWQTGVIAVILLSLPVVARVGLVPVLLLLLAASALYLRWTERIVAGALIAAVGFVPWGARLLVERTAFAGTPAEAVYTLEQGGVGADTASVEIRRRAEQDKAEFGEVYALARYELRRGQLDQAVQDFKRAAQLRGNHPGVFTNLGNALMGKGDLEGAVNAYTTATTADPAYAPALYNLAKALMRQAVGLEGAPAALQQDRALATLQQAEKLDESLAARKDPPEDKLFVDRFLIIPPLELGEWVVLAGGAERGGKIQRQLSLQLLGDFDSPWMSFYPLGLAAALIAFGALKPRLAASLPCEKCGRAVCRRCDPELSPGGTLCGQCVNVFARKSEVPASLRVRKQIEVERHRTRNGRLGYAFGLILSGGGHLFRGLPIRGAAYAFVFLFAVFNLFFRHGFLRAPYGDMPQVLRLAPLGAVLLGVYFSSLLGLYRRQAE